MIRELWKTYVSMCSHLNKRWRVVYATTSIAVVLNFVIIIVLGLCKLVKEIK